MPPGSTAAGACDRSVSVSQSPVLDPLLWACPQVAVTADPAAACSHGDGSPGGTAVAVVACWSCCSCTETGPPSRTATTCAARRRPIPICFWRPSPRSARPWRALETDSGMELPCPGGRAQPRRRPRRRFLACSLREEDHARAGADVWGLPGGRLGHQRRPAVRFLLGSALRQRWSFLLAVPMRSRSGCLPTNSEDCPATGAGTTSL